MTALHHDAIVLELQRFEAMIQRAERRGIRSLSAEEAEAFPQLYRLTLTTVINARSRPLERSFHDYADQLAQRAWALLYIERTPLWRTMVNLFWTHVPAVLWRLKNYLVLNVGIFLLGVISAGFLSRTNAEVALTFVPEKMSDSFPPNAPAELLREMLFMSAQDSVIDVTTLFRLPHFAFLEGQALLATLLAGFTGLLSPFLSFTTGSTLGAMAQRFAAEDLGADYHLWWLSFGFPALVALLLTNSAGCAMLRAVVSPRPEGRWASMRPRWKDLVLISWIALLLMAATAGLALAPNILPTTSGARGSFILLQGALLLPLFVRGYFAARTLEEAQG